MERPRIQKQIDLMRSTPRLGLHLVLGSDFPEMVGKFRRNLDEERCGVVQAYSSAFRK
jgi:hypothetical protein